MPPLMGSRSSAPGAVTTAERDAAAGDGVAILDAAFRPIALDRGAAAIFDSMKGQPDGDGHEVPPAILHRLQSRALQDGDGSTINVGGGGLSYSCRVFVVTPCNGGEPMLTLYLRPETSIADAVYRIGGKYGLSDREQETLIGLFMGLSGQELAEKMKISPNTVKAFIRLAMIKTGARSRAHLFAKLLDRQIGGVASSSP